MMIENINSLLKFTSEDIPEPDEQESKEIYQRLPLTFVPNTGQTNLNVLYHSHGTGCRIFFTPDTAVFVFLAGPLRKEQPARGLALALQFIGANPDVKVEGRLRETGKVNYFKGDNAGKWHTNLSTYKEVAYRGLWPGIDLIFSELNGQIRYQYVLAPGANWEDIRIAYAGANKLTLDEKGNLLINSPIGMLINQHPQSYQEFEGNSMPVETRFFPEQEVNGKNIYCFKVGENYDPGYPLIMTQVLDYSSFQGESDYENGFAVDASGNVYITGHAAVINFPTIPGAFNISYNRLYDAFMTKLCADRSRLIYSTYLGGSGNDFGNEITVDAAGNAYVTGYTTSSNFPTTPRAFDPAFKSGGDKFKAKLFADGSKIIYWK